MAGIVTSHAQSLPFQPICRAHNTIYCRCLCNIGLLRQLGILLALA